MNKSFPCFHITVTDRTTNEILVDTDTAAILGALDLADLGVFEMLFADCNDIEIAETIVGLENVLAEIKEKAPRAADLLRAYKNNNKMN